MTDSQTSSATTPNPLTWNFGAEQLVIRRRYEVASMLNDLMTGLWFVVGSIFFFYQSLQTPAIWLFLIGSIQLLIRPIIRIAKDVHLRRKPYSDRPVSGDNTTPDSGQSQEAVNLRTASFSPSRLSGRNPLMIAWQVSNGFVCELLAQYTDAPHSLQSLRCCTYELDS